MKDKQLALISLFCGPGGMDEGFRQAGFAPSLAYDKDDACVKTYNYNHGSYACAKRADLSLITTEQILQEWYQHSASAPVGLIGGPPCQSFSIGNVYQDPEDERHHLPEHYARILKALNDQFKLDFFVFENVPGLLMKRHRARFDQFVRLAEEAGFHIASGWLDAKDFCVAQYRRRIFVVGVNRDKYPQGKFHFPISNCLEVRTVQDAIAGLPAPTFFEYGLASSEIPHHQNHWCMVPRSKRFHNGTLSAENKKRRSFRVLAWDKPSDTVAYGNNEVHIHPDCQRRLSVYEAMLLQGFPREYVLQGSLTEQFRLVSEAVAPPVARAIGMALKQQLNL